ncbi:MAG: hypothetical protein ACLTMP_12880 [Eggerthella lenta]
MWWVRRSSKSCVAATRKATSWRWTTTPARPEVNQLNRIKLMISVARRTLPTRRPRRRRRATGSWTPAAPGRQEEAGALEIETERA